MKISMKAKGIVGWIVTAALCVQNTVRTYAINWDPYYGEMKAATTQRATADAGEILKQTNQWGSLLEKLLSTFGLNYAGDGKALNYIQIVINYVLSFTAFIALIVIIYGFYMMFFWEEDKAFGKAKKTVTGAAIALFVIAISRSFVNFAFYVFNKGF